MAGFGDSVYNYGSSYEQTPTKAGAKSFIGGVERHAAVDAAKGVASLAGKVIGSLKKGGKVKKTGKYKLHKGEQVIPRNRVKDLAGKLKF